MKRAASPEPRREEKVKGPNGVWLYRVPEFAERRSLREEEKAAVAGIETCNIHSVRAALATGNVDLEHLVACGFNVILMAIRSTMDYGAQKEVIEALLEAGLDPRSTPPSLVYRSDAGTDVDATIEEMIVKPWSGVRAAAGAGNADAVALLVAHGAVLDPAAAPELLERAVSGPRRMSRAERQGRKRTAAILLEAGYPPTPAVLRAACFTVDVPTIKLLLAAGADPSVSSAPDAARVFSAFHAIVTGPGAGTGRAKALKAMIDTGAEPENGIQGWREVRGTATGWYHTKCAALVAALVDDE